jgi:hypothetical protein
MYENPITNKFIIFAPDSKRYKKLYEDEAFQFTHKYRANATSLNFYGYLEHYLSIASFQYKS